MVKATTAVATAAAVCGSYQAATAFVQSAATPSSSSSSPAFRGSVAIDAAAAQQQTSSAPVAMVGAAGALMLVAVAGSNRRAARTARKAAAAVESAEPAVKAPPPPPPFDPAKQVGATEPLGFFDPLGFSKVGDEQGFRNLRTAERKHGRVAMMAAAGAVLQHYVPGDGPKGLGAVFTTGGLVGMVAIVALSAGLELFVWKDDAEGEPGDFGNPFNLEKQIGTAEGVAIGDGPRNRELNNGRFAMICISGIMAAELATGRDAIQQFGIDLPPAPVVAAVVEKAAAASSL